MSVRELIAIVEPPRTPTFVPTEAEWVIAERDLGLVLPADYREFVAMFGSGLLSNFIHVFSPGAPSGYLDLVPSVRRISGIRRDLRESEGDKEVPYDIYPVSPGLVPWGNDENGNTLYWLTQGGPDVWKIVVGQGRGRDWEEFDMPMTTFLAKILQRDLTCSIWPDDFPEPPDDYVFRSY